jgi:hypothetical protein
MRSLSAAQLLQVWEQGMREHPVDRALTLLSTCCDESRNELAGLSIGRRDARLFELYELLFGPEMEAFAQCPECGEPLEYRLSVRDMRLSVPDQQQPLYLEFGATSMRLRLPDSTDLRATSQAHNVDNARKILLERCVVAGDGQEVNSDSWTDDMVEKVASFLGQADPQAETLIDLSCCACRHAWQLLLDIEGFLWIKISTLARRFLREVHALACAYGWREEDILALSAMRRQAYLEMAGSWATF